MFVSRNVVTTLEREVELNRNDFCSTTQLSVIMFDALVAPYNGTILMMGKLLGIMPFTRYSVKGLKH